MKIDLCVPCLFGLEGLAADELTRMGLMNVRAENGRVLCSGSAGDIARANIGLRTGERVLILLAEFEALTFDQLFEGVKNIPWEEWIPAGGAFPVKGHSLDSQLRSVPDCQRIVKKAVVERLKAKYNISWFPESGARCQIQFALMKDRASIYLDTSGAGLHKRGYRPVSGAAPLRETLAAGIVKLSRYKGKGEFCDPFCGSGTIPIEAALAALNRAPGLGRSFDAQAWSWMEKRHWDDAAAEAVSREYRGDYAIWGGDIDPAGIEMAWANAKRAGVDSYVRFELADAARFQRTVPGGILASNPPYGARMMEQREAGELYRKFGSAVTRLEGWKLYILSSHPDFEQHFQKTADKKRKLYNGMIRCNLFMYL